MSFYGQYYQASLQLPASGASGVERNCVMVHSIWNRLTFPGQLLCELISRMPSGGMDLTFTSSHHSSQQKHHRQAEASHACKLEIGFRKIT